MKNTYSPTADQTDSEEPVIFDLNIEDKDILKLIRKPIEDSESYWENEFGLRAVREANVDLWLPNHWKNKDVYDYQEEYLYQDNRIFTSVETICSVVNSRIAQPEVMPGQPTPLSRQMAMDTQKAIFAHSEKYQVADIFRIGTRNLLLKRISWIKLRFDPAVGEFGDIVPEHILPEDMVVDKDAKWNDSPRFIAQKIKNKTGEDLIAMFGNESKQKIYALLGVERRDSKGDLVAYKTQLGQKRNLWEVWFKYYDAEKEMYGSGVAWVDTNYQHVLGKMRNPNWNYDDENLEGYASNFLDTPEPPFYQSNYLNDGSSYIDLTSMVEQAAALQKILDRRGFQIMENADQAGSGLIFNTQMIGKDDIAKLTGSPDERIGVKGDVNKAVMRVAPPPLPSYVIQDKQDARMEIDNIFATHDISRGETSANKTLGQDKMQQAQDYTRMDDIARAIERQAHKYYRGLAQMMKVHYTEEHWFWANGEDGQLDHVMMKNDMIQDGSDITVTAGSTLPPDKKSQMDFASVLAPLGMIDPLSLYEVGSGGMLPSPKKMMERLVKWKTDPLSFSNDLLTDEIDRGAVADIQILLRMQKPQPRGEISPEYLEFMNKYMTASGEFMKQPDEVKANFADWMRECQATADRQMELMRTQLPSPQEMMAANQEAIKQKQVEDQLMGGVDAQGAPAPGGDPAAGGQPPQGGGAPMPDLAAQLVEAKKQQGVGTPAPVV